MTKKSLKAGSVLLALILLLPMLPVSFLKAEAADKPAFTVQSDMTSLFNGDTIIVTFTINNATSQTIYSFDGTLSFNTKILQYAGFDAQQEMCVKVNDAEQQTVTVVDSAVSTGALGFSFSDPTKALIAPGASFTFLKVRLKAVEPGSGQIKGGIGSCHGSEGKLGSFDISQQVITVTAPTTATAAQTVSGSVRLSGLSVTYGTLVPDFNPEFTAYTVEVESDIETVRISASTGTQGATILGEGYKNLEYGMNSFTVRVVGGNGAEMYYGLIITRKEPAPVVSSADITINLDNGIVEEVSTATETVATAPSVIPTAATSIITPDADGGTSGNTPLRVLGISLGVVALFLFGFLAGFFLDKNIKRRELAQEELDELDRRMDRMNEDYGEEYYEEDNGEEYYEEDGNGGLYPESYADGFPQYNGDYSGGYNNGFDDGYRGNSYRLPPV